MSEVVQGAGVGQAPTDEDGRPGETESASTNQLVAVKFEGAATVLNPIEETLRDLEKRYANVAFDLTTTKGDKEARQARSAIVKVRTGADAAYKEWNKPILEEQRTARAMVEGIKARVAPLEKNVDDQIKADEARREKEREERARIEAERVAKIRARIATLASVPDAAAAMSSEELDAVLDDMTLVPLTEERFAEFLAEATGVHAGVVERLRTMRAAAAASEEQQRQLKAQQEELERQRAELARQQEQLAEQRKAQEEEVRRTLILREEQERAASEKQARDQADAARTAAGQTDAFPGERAEAIDTLRAAAPEREPRRAVRPAIDSKPVLEAAKEPSPDHGGDAASDDEINAAAAIAASDDRLSTTEEILSVTADSFQTPVNEPRDAEPPHPGLIVAIVAEALDVHTDAALELIRSIDWHSVTEEEVRDGE